MIKWLPEGNFIDCNILYNFIAWITKIYQCKYWFFARRKRRYSQQFKLCALNKIFQAIWLWLGPYKMAVSLFPNATDLKYGGFLFLITLKYIIQIIRNFYFFFLYLCPNNPKMPNYQTMKQLHHKFSTIFFRQPAICQYKNKY